MLSSSSSATPLPCFPPDWNTTVGSFNTLSPESRRKAASTQSRKGSSTSNQSSSAAVYCPGWKAHSARVSGNSGEATRFKSTSPTAIFHSIESQALPASVGITLASSARSS